ncbi:hypothetical protein LX15_001882 [Streptoalloteichus tenebrarius]|uniref:Knr4/Smi1-like domain-containing protein n=1 Tax=Streptoalloteichus tenebrarius (strain ATCC 17920 / DSM 40477 / JCM 4838 / CBS 697.72 / NBRC 16177 / NCIMB 11028 / NRRL B-12390 / A12253. 1 / ISP 5477) TaxID=1933 RepID=A0ABT1HRU1_STRSD|nr:SMI1/KNR4 family protein [Streptoalloteichus tenebrarius]MCP2258188.1 hypothetical protein [Streptoalloteichus tenebrarius]BFF04583.1 hypothetical protein GCM10020241_62580 [Streptoalloteichus tenebrarius]
MSHRQASSFVDDIARTVGWERDFRPGLDWLTVEHGLGTLLPTDYKELFSRFPSGVFRNSVRMHSPVEDDDWWQRFKANVDEVLEVIGDEDLEYLEGVDYRLFPEPGGLLPWGDDLQGGMFFWLTQSANPDEWPIAYYSQGSDEWREHSGPMTKVILEVLTNEGDDNIMHRNLSHRPADFITAYNG